MAVDLLTQLNRQKMKVDFDSYDITVRELVTMTSSGLIDVAPEYQRQFRWQDDRQSSFIESLFLGIPIPSLFTAANVDGTWELIDGVQRLSTLVRFVGDDATRDTLNLSTALRLGSLEKLTDFNGTYFNSLPIPVQTQFLLRPLKVITVSDKSDYDVRFDLFERLNSGGVTLTDQEIRSCIFRGQFSNLLRDLADDPNFRIVVRLPKASETDGTREELVLKFFAYLYGYTDFQHSVRDFLNDYMKLASTSFDYVENVNLFREVFSHLARFLPQGLTRGNTKTTPYNLYEGVSVGAALAWKQSGTLDMRHIVSWLKEPELKRLTTGATNSRTMVEGRIEFCRDRFLGD